MSVYKVPVLGHIQKTKTGDSQLLISSSSHILQFFHSSILTFSPPSCKLRTHSKAVKPMKLIPLFIFLFACSGSSEKVSDPLAMFPLNDEWEFLSGLGRDRIIMLLKRTEENKFTYRIELVKDYYGLPLDYGTVSLKQIEKDSSFSF